MSAPDDVSPPDGGAGCEPRWWSAAHPELASSSDPGCAAEVLGRLVTDDPTVLRRRSLLLGLLARHGARLADRDHHPGHLTASALVVDGGSGRVALLLHTKLGRWLQPGGHADGDFQLAGVALREAAEETGLEGLEILPRPVDLDVHAVDHDDGGRHLHLDVRFVVRAPAGGTLRSNHESDAIRWVAPEAVGELTDEPGIQRLVRRGLAVQREVSAG